MAQLKSQAKSFEISKWEVKEQPADPGEGNTSRGPGISRFGEPFMHYAFDLWLAREFPTITFERYADDAVIHCVTERQAQHVLAALTDRMAEVGLRLHPAKTRIVYCKDGKRQNSRLPC